MLSCFILCLYLTVHQLSSLNYHFPPFIDLYILYSCYCFYTIWPLTPFVLCGQSLLLVMPLTLRFASGGGVSFELYTGPGLPWPLAPVFAFPTRDMGMRCLEDRVFTSLCRPLCLLSSPWSASHIRNIISGLRIAYFRFRIGDPGSLWASCRKWWWRRWMDSTWVTLVPLHQVE